MGPWRGQAFERHREAVRQRLVRAPFTTAGPDSVSWKINREMVVVVGWGRAILLQFAHPLVAAGVSEHSQFRGGLLSSFRRLSSTVRAMLSLTFGSEEDAINAAAVASVLQRFDAHTLICECLLNRGPIRFEPRNVTPVATGLHE